MRFRFRIESSGLSKQNSLQSSFAGAKTTSRRFSLMNGASLPLALALGTTLCGGALLAGPVQAAPTVGSDENGPQVRIIAPSYQDVIKGSFRIAVAVTAKNYNPESIEMLVDDQSATDGPVSLSAFGNVGKGPTSFDWDTRKFTDGPHKLTVRVTDKQGFRGWAEVNIFINNKRAVDTLPPSLDWQNIENYTAVSGRASIQLDAKDNFGVKMLMVTINPVDQPNKKPASATWLLNRPPYVVNFDSTRLNDGLYILKANAWDSMDQQGDAKEMTIGVINNPVNARTYEEALNGLRAFDTAVSKPAQPRVNTELPSGVKPNTQTVTGLERLDPNRNVTTPKVVAPPQKTNLAAPIRQGALTTQTPNVETIKAPTVAPILTPSQPSLGLRGVPTAPVKTPVVNTATPKPKPVVVAQAEPVESVAVPQLSSIGSKSEPVATLQLSPIESGVDNSSQAPRLAALSNSDLAMRENAKLPNTPVEVDTPSLSRVVEVERTARVNAIETQITTKQSDVQARLSTPLIQTRFVEAARTVASVAKSVTTPKKLEVAAVPVADVEKAAQPSLTKRWTVPSLPIAQSPKATAVAPKVEAERVGAVTKPVAIAAAPSEKAAITEPVAQLSAPKAVTPKVSSAFGNVRGGVSKVVRKTIQSAKVEIAEQPVLAALPQAGKTVISPRHAAITVSPIEVSAGTMPSVYRVERTTTLRAIAARYGLPVELVAACNVWPVEMNVVKGMTVKLPRPLQVSYNGSPVDSDAQSMLVGDTAVAAFRFMFEKSGGTMKWDAKTQRVIAKKGETEISLTIGSKTAKVGDKEVMMELAAFLFEGRTMVPIRLFEEGLRAEIEWDPQTGRMVVAMINSTSPSAVMNG